jgi:hypothetical protein
MVSFPLAFLPNLYTFLFSPMELKLFTSTLQGSNSALVRPGWRWWMRKSRCNENSQVKLKYSEETASVPFCPQKNPTWHNQGSNPGPQCGDKGCDLAAWAMACLSSSCPSEISAGALLCLHCFLIKVSSGGRKNPLRRVVPVKHVILAGWFARRLHAISVTNVGIHNCWGPQPPPLCKASLSPREPARWYACYVPQFQTKAVQKPFRVPCSII